MTDTRHFAFIRARELLDQAEAPPEAAPSLPWHEHGAFDDIDAARWEMERVRAALVGLAALLQPASLAADEQLNMARRSDVFAVLDFFAACLAPHLRAVDAAAARLRQDLRAGKMA